MNVSPVIDICHADTTVEQCEAQWSKLNHHLLQCAIPIYNKLFEPNSSETIITELRTRGAQFVLRISEDALFKAHTISPTPALIAQHSAGSETFEHASFPLQGVSSPQVELFTIAAFEQLLRCRQRIDSLKAIAFSYDQIFRLLLGDSLRFSQFFRIYAKEESSDETAEARFCRILEHRNYQTIFERSQFKNFNRLNFVCAGVPFIAEVLAEIARKRLPNHSIEVLSLETILARTFPIAADETVIAVMQARNEANIPRLLDVIDNGAKFFVANYSTCNCYRTNKFFWGMRSQIKKLLAFRNYLP